MTNATVRLASLKFPLTGTFRNHLNCYPSFLATLRSAWDGYWADPNPTAHSQIKEISMEATTRMRVAVTTMCTTLC
jgi:hypothetical protein